MARIVAGTPRSMGLLELLLVILLIGAVFGYGGSRDLVWLIVAIVLIFALFGNYSYTR
jgi:hypothetical protein